MIRGEILVRPLVSGHRREYVRLLGDGSEMGSRAVEQAVDTWQLKASCRGPQAEIFFPPAHAERKEEKLQREERAKAICRSCAVRVECLDYAIRIHEAHGIWGGLNEMERRQYAERRVG